MFHNKWIKHLFGGILAVWAFAVVANEAPLNCDQYCNKAEYCKGDECLSCEKGTFQSSNWHKKGECEKHTPKPPGHHWVLKKKGSNSSDNEWECEEGHVKYQFSSIRGKHECRPITTSMPILPENETGITPTVTPPIQTNVSYNGTNLKENNSDDKTVMIIVGLVLGIIFVTGVAICFFCKKKKKSNNRRTNNEDNPPLGTNSSDGASLGQQLSLLNSGNRDEDDEQRHITNQLTHNNKHMDSQQNDENSAQFDSNKPQGENLDYKLHDENGDTTQKNTDSDDKQLGESRDVKQQVKERNVKQKAESTDVEQKVEESDDEQQGENSQDDILLPQNISSSKKPCALHKKKSKLLVLEFAKLLISDLKEQDTLSLFHRLEKEGYNKPSTYHSYSKVVNNHQPMAAHIKTLVDYMQTCCIQHKPVIADIKRILNELNKNEILEHDEFRKKSIEIEMLFHVRAKVAKTICNDLERETCEKLINEIERAKKIAKSEKFSEIKDFTEQKCFIWLMDLLDDLTFTKELDRVLRNLYCKKENDKLIKDPKPLIDKIYDIYQYPLKSTNE